MWKQNEKLDYSQNIGHKTNTVLILWSDIRARNIQQWLKLEKNKRQKNQGRKNHIQGHARYYDCNWHKSVKTDIQYEKWVDLEIKCG